MKKLYTLLAVLILATSCGQEFKPQDWSKSTQSKIAFLCKVEIAKDEYMIWPSNTKIGLFCPQIQIINKPIGITQASSGTEGAEFYDDTPWGEGQHDFFLYYPYRNSTETTAITGLFNGSVSENIYLGSISANKPEKAELIDINLNPLFDLCKIIINTSTYTDCGLERISMQSESNASLCGEWSYDIASGTFSYTTPQNNMTINISNTMLSDVPSEINFLSYNAAELSENVNIMVTLSKGDGNIVLTSDALLTQSNTWDLDTFASSVVEDSSINLADPDNDGVMETANCYIASQVGETYRFPATVMGNGATLPEDASCGGKAPGITPIDLNPKSAQVLWQTGPSLITNVKLTNGYVYFTLNGDGNGNFLPGNALIAVYSDENCTGTILWSWHIWVTDADLDSLLQTWTVHNDVAAYSAYQDPQLMDRNLGALSNLDWATSNTNFSKGLNYQWGRKDPFVGPDNSSWASRVAVQTYNSDGQEISTTIEEASQFSNAAKWTNVAQKLSQADIAKYPMVFVSGANNRFWMENESHDLWGCPGYTYDMNDIGRKTIYDPCPPGYRVMNSYAMSGVTSSINGGGLASLTHNVLNADTYRANGEDLQVKCNEDEIARIPASGLVFYEKAQTSFPFERTGTYGHIWTNSGTCTVQNRAVRVQFDWNNFRSRNNAFASYGQNVRCEKIK